MRSKLIFFLGMALILSGCGSGESGGGGAGAEDVSVEPTELALEIVFAPNISDPTKEGGLVQEAPGELRIQCGVAPSGEEFDKCSAIYPVGESVRLRADSRPGWKFSNWVLQQGHPAFEPPEGSYNCKFPNSDEPTCVVQIIPEMQTCPPSGHGCPPSGSGKIQMNAVWDKQ